ncbi:MAG TPA: nucleotidyltransferase [Candidatus Magasanikbacteria bacterium]|nr:MAG: hypothetical protein A3I74_03815 [Candidatus Magasanikbacteria bacterium RIFCSPLOWO2_02_FULL_47_16]OGH79294.1 MAG: hypothetical protein A3C10_04355 [Candidatus Magasanikbacteria bacterium RIFCSPHIGHO2_02_FULL_48_18]OGH82220.1 MAG: hypothetical protein A3G08_00975 [Candidatus Magasanikbacteria bacterium RIFCSPLOWO2_12_FULL_47_9b]HAZ28404.1 nucleotidyltransferase [Candidatus Magasanikbacteria bacterium]
MAKKRISKKTEKKIDGFISSLKKDGTPITSLYLFGSHAKGTAHEWSDIDLAVISPAFETRIKDPLNYLWGKRMELKEFAIEPVGFSPKDFKEGGMLINEIKRHGIRIL